MIVSLWGPSKANREARETLFVLLKTQGVAREKNQSKSPGTEPIRKERHAIFKVSERILVTVRGERNPHKNCT